MATLIDDSGTTRFEGTITGASDLLTASVRVSRAQMLALFTTPIQVVAAPDAGHAVIPVFWTAQTIGQTTGYTLAGVIGLRAGSSAYYWNDASSQIASASSFLKPWDTLNGGGVPAADLDGAPLLFAADTGNPTVGDGAVRVTVVYYIAAVV